MYTQLKSLRNSGLTLEVRGARLSWCIPVLHKLTSTVHTCTSTVHVHIDTECAAGCSLASMYIHNIIHGRITYLSMVIDGNSEGPLTLYN